MAQCDSCRKQISGRSTTTVTGRSLCAACNQKLLGAATGVMAAGPDVSISAKTASAVATSGFFSRLRRHRPGAK